MNMILSSERFLAAVILTKEELLKSTATRSTRYQTFALAMAEVPSVLQGKFKEWTKQAFPDGADAVMFEPWSYKDGTPKPTKRKRSHAGASDVTTPLLACTLHLSS